jgi:membrane protein implicated in regulation of membrane protease activity
MSAAVVWAIVAAVALGIEVFTLDLTFALIAIGALSGAGIALVGAPLWASVVVAAGVSLAGIVFVRPVALRHLRRMPIGARTGVDALPGAEGHALTEITVLDGRMKLRGEEWTARLDPDVTEQPVPTGTRLVVTRIDGATALVHPID